MKEIDWKRLADSYQRDAISLGEQADRKAPIDPSGIALRAASYVAIVLRNAALDQAERKADG